MRRSSSAGGSLSASIFQLVERQQIPEIPARPVTKVGMRHAAANPFAAVILGHSPQAVGTTPVVEGGHIA